MLEYYIVQLENNNLMDYYNNINRETSAYYGFISENQSIIERLDQMRKIQMPKLSLENAIATEISELGYTIANIEESNFEDFDDIFLVITVELKDEISNYNDLLLQEKNIKNKLNLYAQKVILEIV